MAKLMTGCPVTGQLIDTRIEIDEASFPRLPPFNGKVFCSHCGTEHEWSKDKAFLVDDAKSKSVS
jgi:hypothetical protein